MSLSDVQNVIENIKETEVVDDTALTLFEHLIYHTINGNRQPDPKHIKVIGETARKFRLAYITQSDQFKLSSSANEMEVKDKEPILHSKTKKEPSTSSLIQSLINSEWGHTPRTIREIGKKLPNAKYKTLSSLLCMLTKKGKIKRLGTYRHYRYYSKHITIENMGA